MSIEIINAGFFVTMKIIFPNYNNKISALNQARIKSGHLLNFY